MRTYEIQGKPIPLQRHRHAGKITYDPQKREKYIYQQKIQEFLKDFLPLYSAIKLVIEYHMPIPKSYSKKRALEFVFKPHIKKPDLSNLIKFTEDALNGMVWRDDSIIAEISAKKFYSKETKTVFKIECLDY